MYDVYLIHVYAHTIGMAFAHLPDCKDCRWCYPGVAQTCSPENPITADEEPWTIVDEITLRAPQEP